MPSGVSRSGSGKVRPGWWRFRSRAGRAPSASRGRAQGKAAAVGPAGVEVPAARRYIPGTPAAVGVARVAAIP
ncbi:hypothetical protein GCM10023196_063610 [Actinoallomurus vinaceus]|uniref:Uncharacterized protein n=1 Tax=Actinoallomurus vinaceus TaxID=1080074 RepID=A0ABP8UHA8_9ACTN